VKLPLSRRVEKSVIVRCEVVQNLLQPSQKTGKDKRLAENEEESVTLREKTPNKSILLSYFCKARLFYQLPPESFTRDLFETTVRAGIYICFLFIWLAFLYKRAYRVLLRRRFLPSRMLTLLLELRNDDVFHSYLQR